MRAQALTMPDAAEVDRLSSQPWTPEVIALVPWGATWRARRAEGYLDAAPHGAREGDGPIAEAAVCPLCGAQMAYAPLWHRTSRAYRPFAVCSPCDRAVEF